MSIELNERQLLATQFLAIGLKLSEVAEKLSVARETISRWQQLSGFGNELRNAEKNFIKELIKREFYLLDRAQESIGLFLMMIMSHLSEKQLLRLDLYNNAFLKQIYIFD